MGAGAVVGIAAAVAALQDEELAEIVKTFPADDREKISMALAACNDANKKDEEDLWYFAIGSMTNPTSLAARGLTPQKSVPAKLLDHRLLFTGPEGMASQEEAAGQSFHGVLHLMSAEEMKKLDAIELSYDRVMRKVQLYDGTQEDSVVYSMNTEMVQSLAKGGNIINNTPQQRYIDIISEGCKHFGVAQEHIDWLKKQPCRQRAKPEEYLKFEVPEGTRVMTLEEVRGGDAVGDHPFYRVANKKVMEYRGPKAGPFYEQGKHKAGSSEDMFFGMAKTLYDPLFGVPTSQDEMTAQHYAYREDMMKRMAIGVGSPDMWVVVGVLE